MRALKSAVAIACPKLFKNGRTRHPAPSADEYSMILLCVIISESKMMVRESEELSGSVNASQLAFLPNNVLFAGGKLLDIDSGILVGPDVVTAHEYRCAFVPYGDNLLVASRNKVCVLDPQVHFC